MLESNAPKELILHFVRDVGRADLAKGFENNAKSELPALKERIDSLKELMADMGKGQRLRFAYKPGAGAQVDVESAVKATIKGDDFARALVSIWLGPRPPNADLKTGLLGGQCG